MALLFDIGIVIVVATAIAYMAKLFRQPLIVAYVIAGVLVGPVGLGLITNPQEIATLAELGIAFLLFTAGLEIDFRRLRSVGFATLGGGIAQMLITFVIGFGLAWLLGFDSILGITIGLLVAFSSTMIVTKILIDRSELQSLHGRMMIGILLLQDIAVIMAIPLMGSLTGGLSLEFMASILLKGVGLFAIAVVLNRFLFPRLLDFAAGMREVLFLTAVSTVFIFIGASSLLGFSIAVGAFIAGLALGNFPYNLEIVGETRALRDFFSIIFFTSLGMSLNFAVMGSMALPFLALLALIMIVKPIILTTLYMFMGYGARTSSVIGVGLGQASEFSFIIAAQGILLGQFSQEFYSLLLSVVVVSMVLTPYLMRGRNRLSEFYAKLFSPLMKGSHRRIRKMESPPDGLKNHTIVLGCDIMGGEVVRWLRKNKKRFLVVDHDPEKVKALKKRGMFVIYGNADHTDILKRTGIRRAKALVITIPDDAMADFMIRKAKRMNKNIRIVARAFREEEASKLKDAGAHTVVLPESVTGKRMVRELKRLFRSGRA